MMTPREFLGELTYPVRSGAALVAMITFILLMSLARAAGMLGIWLAIATIPAFLRYLTMIAEARAQGRDAAPPGIEYFSLVGNVAISLIAGTVVGVTAVIIGAPFPVALAVIVGVFDLVPQVGSTIAAFIVCLITLAGSGLGAALILAVVIIVYQQVENYLVQPAVYSTAVDLSGFATIASVLVGGALLGVIGAILAVPVTAALKVIFGEVMKPRRERMAAMRAAEPAPQET